MPNTNCLEGFKCPACGAEDEFRITISQTAIVNDDGVEDVVGDNEWESNSACQCGACDHEGKVWQFNGEDEPEPTPATLERMKDFADVVEAFVMHGDVNLTLQIAEMRLYVAQHESDQEEIEFQRNIIGDIKSRAEIAAEEVLKFAATR